MKKAFLLLFILLAVAFTGCSSETQVPLTPVSENDFALDTVVTITLFEENDALFEEIFDLIHNYENILSRHIESSEVYLINEKASSSPVSLSDTTKDIITSAIEYSELSDGYFDITIGPLVNLWDINSSTIEREPPAEKDILDAESLVDYKQLILTDNTIQFNDENMVIDLGGIAKGYITDRIVDLLNERKIDTAIINLGGNVYVHGSKGPDTPFIVGIQDPDNSRGNILGTIKVSDHSVVTSGLYERFFTYNEEIFHHIINPFTGYPENNNLKGVSIISKYSLDGDALSTTLFLLGLEKGYALAESLEDVEVIFVTKDNEVIISSGLKDNFNLTNENYIYGTDFEH